MIPRLIQLYSLQNDQIKHHYCTIISSFLPLVPDYFYNYINFIIQSCFELLLHPNEDIFCDALSAMESLASSFKKELQPHVQQSIVIVLKRLEGVIPTIDNFFEDKPAVLTNNINPFLDHLSGEYTEEFTSLFIEACKCSSWEASLLAVCSISTGSSHQNHPE